MSNNTVQAAFHSFQQKLDSFKTKIEFQQLLAGSLAAEFESLTSEFESLKQLFGASSPNFESTSENIGATSHNNESSSSNNGASSLLQSAQYSKPDGGDCPGSSRKKKTIGHGDAADYRCISKFAGA
jgi:peptidoglycan hydrolase CwlO-like protein